MTDEPTDRPPSPSDPVTAAELWRRPWYVVPDDEIGGWAIATADLPTSQLNLSNRGERVIADAIWEDHARWLVEAHNRLIANVTEPTPAAAERTAREDAYVTAYAALHEVVRRFLEDGANLRYLRRHHVEIDVDLRARLHQTVEPIEES